MFHRHINESPTSVGYNSVWIFFLSPCPKIEFLAFRIPVYHYVLTSKRSFLISGACHIDLL